jgi:NAD-dependent deacetylase
VTPASLLSSRLEQVLAEARRVVALTGAGISAESGVPTFRAPDGYWAQYDPMELATPDAFRCDPDLVWRWYSHRRRVIAAAAPNAGHLALAEMETLFSDMTVITQNVDDLHHRAGSTRVIALHGGIERSRCAACGRAWHGDAAPPSETDPRCDCGGRIRPGVVWFGESLPADALRAAAATAETAELFLTVGTSGLVHPAAGLPDIARRAGAYCVEINPERTPLSSRMHEVLDGPAGVVLPLIAAAARRLRCTA